MTPKPLQKGCWPKEIVVCLECGEYETSDDAIRSRAGCQNKHLAPHGPTRTVPVLPAELVEGLVAGLERIAQTDWTQPPDEMPEEMARDTLASYRQAIAEGTDGD